MKRQLRTCVGLVAVVGLVAACSAPAPANGGPERPARSFTLAGDCINPTAIDKQEIVSDREIRFTMRGGDVWVNHLRTACYGLKSEAGFQWDVRGTQVCSNQQTIKVLRVGTPCQLGKFTKMPRTESPSITPPPAGHGSGDRLPRHS